VNKELVNLNGDAELLVSDTGRELRSPALTHQMFPTTVWVLPDWSINLVVWFIRLLCGLIEIVDFETWKGAYFKIPNTYN